MNSTERVRNAIFRKPVDRQPIYGWVAANLSREIAAAYGRYMRITVTDPGESGIARIADLTVNGIAK